MSGDFGGLASSLASTITGISKRHDKKRDKLIEKAQEQINAINRLTDIMERTLDRTLGGIYNYVQSSEVTKGLNYAKNTDRYDSYYDYRDWRSKSYEGENPIKSAAKEALESATYFDTQLALLQQEKAELQKQMEAESRARKQKLLTVAGAAGGAAIGGSAMLFGGEGAAMSGATIGGMAGAMGARGVANPARAARKEEIQRRSGLLENPHKTKITVHPKRTGIEGVRKIEAGAPKTKESVATKRKAKESMQKGESEILKKAEGIYRTDGHLAKGNQMIDKALKDGKP
jgi:hypothetical protein